MPGGGALSGSGGARDRHEALNRTVLPALAEQIRLRNLSGGIMHQVSGCPPEKGICLLQRSIDRRELGVHIFTQTH